MGEATAAQCRKMTNLLPPNGSAGMQLATANVNDKRDLVLSLENVKTCDSVGGPGGNRDTAAALADTRARMLY